MILIAIGANLPAPDGAPPLETCRRAAAALAGLPELRLVALSRWYETTPVPASAQPLYVNGVARLEGPADPAALLGALQEIELREGRERGVPNAPRTLDLDLLAVGDQVRLAPDPVLPHPRLHERAFVLVPLADVAPGWVHPVFARSVDSLIAELPADQEIRPIPDPPPLRSERLGDVAVITLHDPAKRNALGSAMMQALQDELAACEAGRVRAVVLRADPVAAVFSAGHDIHELRPGDDPLGADEPLQRTLRAVRGYPGAVLAMVRGSVWGGAVELVCSCDIVVADPSARFALTPANLGLPYNTAGLMHLLQRLPLNLLKEMFLTAAPIEAERALDWHIINHLVPADELEPFTMRLAATIAGKAPLAIIAVKEQLRTLIDEQPLPVHAVQRLEALRRRAWQGADFREGLAAFREKRPGRFRGE